MTNIHSFPPHNQYEQPDFWAINRAHDLMAGTGRVNYLLPGSVGIERVYADADVMVPEVFSPLGKPTTRHGNGYDGTSRTRRQNFGEGIPTELPATTPVVSAVNRPVSEEDRVSDLRNRPYAAGFRTASSDSERAKAESVLRQDSARRKSN